MNAVGRLLKYHRLQQGLKQDYVCKGICTVSHLSKVENGKTNAPQSLVRAIFKRLNITYCDEGTFIEEYKELLENAFRDIVYNRSVDEIYSALSQVDAALSASPLFVDYLIFKRVYGLSKWQSLESDSELLLLLQIEDVMDQTQRGWFYYVLASSDIPIKDISTNLSMVIKDKDDCFVWAQAMLGSSYILSSRMIYHYFHGRYDIALGIVDEAVHYALKEGNASALAMIYLMSGNCFAARGMVEEAYPHYQRARQLFYDLNRPDKLAAIDYNLGATQLENERYDKAKYYFEKGLTHSKISETQLFSFYEKLALLHGELEQKHLARRYLIKAQGALLALTKLPEKHRAIYNLRLSLAALRIVDNYQDLLEYRNVLEKLCRQLRENTDISWGYFNFYKRYLHDLYCRQRQYKKALRLTNVKRR